MIAHFMAGSMATYAARTTSSFRQASHVAGLSQARARAATRRA